MKISNLVITASALAISTSAYGQAAPSGPPPATTVQNAQPASDEGNRDEIVVTGTLIRGIQPPGANVVSIGEDEIEATGVNNTNQLLAQIPQGTYFNQLPQPAEGVIQLGTSRAPINRPNLRNIPFQTNTSGAPTLVLIDGHRVVPSGTEQAVVEPGVVPTSILRRVEVILDGASAVYGSDAVGGVINFITRKRFDGLEVSGRYGFADDYWQADAGITGGLSWGTGGIVLNYEFAKNSSILNRDRSFAAPLNWIIPDPGNPGSFLPPQVDDLACATPNVGAGANRYHVSGSSLVLGPQYCAANDYETYIPVSTRHSVFATFSQDLTDGVTFELTGLYSRRLQETNSGPFAATVNVESGNPNRPIGSPAGTHSVSFNYSPVFGNEQSAVSTLHEIWQITPQIQVGLGGSWQARALFAYGESVTRVLREAVDTTTQSARVNSGLINPYNIAASAPGAFNNLFWTDRTEGRHTFHQARVVADGTLLTLPGGEIRAAIGAEWLKYGFTRLLTSPSAPFAPLAPSSGSSESKAIFGEVIIPIFGPDNGGPGMHSLLLSASGRYDHYKSFGGTFNPKIGLTYQPVEWVTVRGNWATSFRAPNAVDDAAAGSNQLRCLGTTATPACFYPLGFQVPPGQNVDDFNDPDQVFLFLTGTDPTVGPETSKSWSIGMDVSPPFLPGLTLGATYWFIDFKDVISTPLVGASLAPVFTGFPDAFEIGPISTGITGQALDRILGLAPQGPQIRSVLESSGYRVAYFIDGRVQNLGGAKISGVDVTARYQQVTGFGSIDAMVNVALPLKQDLKLAPVGPVTDNLEFNTPHYRINASLGATIGNFRAQTLIRHTAGYTPSAGTIRHPSQTTIPSFTVVDLAFRYRFEGDEWRKGLELSANINNVFDTDPPLSKTANGGTINGQTLGRLIQFGISKSF